MRRIAPLLLVVLAGCGSQAAPAPQRGATVRPAFTPAKERDTRPEGRWLTARITQRVRMHATPGGRLLRAPRLTPRTEFGSDKVVSVLARRGGWLRVIAPERPNGSAAWIPARAARLGAVDVSIRVDRSARRLTVRRGDRVVRTLPVAVGRPGTETPTGRFAVTDRLHTGRADSPYGCCALALSGHQPKLLPGWPGGDRLAIHATPQAGSVGTAASLGCMRARTSDMRALMRIVPLGTPVFVSL